MLTTLLSATLAGLDGRLIRVEVDVAPGLPGFTIVGLADEALREARERVRGAIRNSGLIYPPRRITVNLAPPDLRKGGSSLDVAIAVGILVGSGQVEPRARMALVGELSLSGSLRAPAGLFPMVAHLARRRVPRVLVPADADAEARLVSGIDVVSAADLGEVVGIVQGRPNRRSRASARPSAVDLAEGEAGPGRPSESARTDRLEGPDLADVRGQAEARRGLEIALAGGHGLVLVGPPGSGKTLLARTIPSLLPPLRDAEAVEVTVIASVAGQSDLRGLARARPFRAPHHTLSYAAMVGGGPHLSPGEVTRAHHGVLFLDELPEFGRDVLEALRQPLEDGRVLIARAGRSYSFPARFQLVAAMNPCPCGRAGLEDAACQCPPGLAERYARRVSGPLRDRIDIWVAMPRVRPEELVTSPPAEGSDLVRDRISRAHDRQWTRDASMNARLSGAGLRSACALTPGHAALAVDLAEHLGLSARGTERLLRVARTIADLAGSGQVGREHLEEAARFRAPVPLAALRRGAA